MYVLMLHADGNTYHFTVPPEAILLIEGILPDDEYRKLIERTPRISTLAAR